MDRLVNLILVSVANDGSNAGGGSAQPLSSDRLECMFDENISRRSYIYIVLYSVSNVAIWLQGHPALGEPDGWPDELAGR